MSNQILPNGQDTHGQANGSSAAAGDHIENDRATEAATELIQPQEKEENTIHDTIQPAYFSTKSTPETANRHITQTIINLAKQIEAGHVVIRDSPISQKVADKALDKLEDKRKQRQELERQIDLLNLRLEEHRRTEEKQRVEKQIKRRGRRSTEQQQKIEVDRKIDHWREEKKINEMRKALSEKRQRERQQRQKAEEEKRYEEAARKVSQERRRHFEQYMSSLEKRKQQRLKQIAQKAQPLLSKSSRTEVVQKHTEELLITMPERPKVDFMEIKKHEMQYMQKVKERSPKFSANPIVEHPEQFHLLDRRESEITREKAKVKRRQDFDKEVVKSIPLSIDSEKRRLSDIAADKSKNKIKYMILGKQGLSDEEIFNYKEKEFNLGDSNRIRRLGDSYLEQIKDVRKKARSERSVSVKSLPQNSNLQIKSPPRYTNYLETGKHPRLDEMQRLILHARNKPEELMQKSDEYENQVLKEIREFSKKKDGKTYKQSMDAESRIDDLYLKALKARVACATILK